MEIILPVFNFDTQVLFYLSCLFTLMAGDIIYMAFFRKKPELSIMTPEEKPGFRISGFSMATLLNSLILALCITGLNRLANTDPVVIDTFPKPDSILTSYQQPVRFEFSAPVDFSKITTNKYPDNSGTWTFHRYLPFLPYGRIVTYTPKTSYLSGQKVMLHLANINRPFANKYGSEFLLQFTAHPPPDVIATEPADNSQEVPIATDVIFKLSNANGIFSHWSIDISPDTPYNLENKNGELIIKFANRLMQGTDYKLNAYQTGEITDLSSGKIISEGVKTLAGSIDFSTVKPPLITSFKPEGDVIPTEPVVISFDHQMDQNQTQQMIKIAPETEGSFSWSDQGQTLRFQPVRWPLDTDVTVTLQKGISSTTGAVIDDDIVYRFRTIGELGIKNTEPKDMTDNIPTTTSVKITFNQEPDHTSAEKYFVINPPVKGSFTWDGNTMIFKADNRLANDTEYKINLLHGIKSVYGKDLSRDLGFKFRTIPETYSINVPYFKQNELFTCNIAAVRMLLAYRGITKAEAELKSEIGTNGYRGNGNPHLGYTANYGTYWEPIAKMVSKYRPYQLYENWNIQDLVKEVAKGNPVMIWGQNGWSDPHEISWTNPDGTKIYAINGMHSSVVRGFVGPVSNPTSIIINDPWRGVSTISTKEFVRRWSFFSVALIVD